MHAASCLEESFKLSFRFCWFQTTTTPRPVYSNCREILPNKLQVKWELQGEYVQIELFGRISEDQYMAFGLSGANGRAQMAQSDVVVAFYDTNARVFRAEDYFISDLSQCDGHRGVCPDERLGARNNVVVGMLFKLISSGELT